VGALVVRLVGVDDTAAGPRGKEFTSTPWQCRTPWCKSGT
jgi:hypothetical protein